MHLLADGRVDIWSGSRQLRITALLPMEFHEHPRVAMHSPKTAQIRKTTANLGKDGLVVRHVTIFGRGHGLQRAIIDESQHRTPERLIMAQH